MNKSIVLHAEMHKITIRKPNITPLTSHTLLTVYQTNSSASRTLILANGRQILSCTDLHITLGRVGNRQCCAFQCGLGQIIAKRSLNLIGHSDHSYPVGTNI